MKLKNGAFSWIKECKCPCCGVGSFEFINSDGAGILVNAETKGRVLIDNFWIPSKVCNNPLCEWSKIKQEIIPMNMISPTEAWEIMETWETKK